MESVKNCQSSSKKSRFSLGGASVGNNNNCNIAEEILQEKSFEFLPRHGSLDVDRIMKANIDGIRCNADVDALQDLLETSVFSLITLDDITSFTPECLYRFFVIMQLVAEYLLNVQDTLADQLDVMSLKYDEKKKSFREVKFKLQKKNDLTEMLLKQLSIKGWNQPNDVPLQRKGIDVGIQTSSDSLLEMAIKSLGKFERIVDILSEEIKRGREHENQLRKEFYDLRKEAMSRHQVCRPISDINKEITSCQSSSSSNIFSCTENDLRAAHTLCALKLSSHYKSFSSSRSLNSDIPNKSTSTLGEHQNIQPNIDGVEVRDRFDTKMIQMKRGEETFPLTAVTHEKTSNKSKLMKSGDDKRLERLNSSSTTEVEMESMSFKSFDAGVYEESEDDEKSLKCEQNFSLISTTDSFDAIWNGSYSGQQNRVHNEMLTISDATKVNETQELKISKDESSRSEPNIQTDDDDGTCASAKRKRIFLRMWRPRLPESLRSEHTTKGKWKWFH